ncbi:hypothetical protein I553_9071 [Mycobacterium xenopi 4042]|uniref:Uncharacterized protein n=1 Tax=Mycobacterium xenopi 4042 TaxID=1299334 RepID=X8APA3_MYCXE|nr:hypothetical protein I553_9071 [Mycobacterium xenopi 4042]
MEPLHYHLGFGRHDQIADEGYLDNGKHPGYERDDAADLRADGGSRGDDECERNRPSPVSVLLTSTEPSMA